MIGARTGGSGQPLAWPPVKNSVRTFMTASTPVCHTVCPSTAIAISSNIVNNRVQVIDTICALPGDRFGSALTVAAILTNFLIVTAEGARLVDPIQHPAAANVAVMRCGLVVAEGAGADHRA